VRLPVVVLGASGHAKVVIELLEEDSSIVIHGCTSPDSAKAPGLACPLLGTDETLPDILRSGVKHAFVAIGDNRIRFRAMRAVTELGFSLVRAVSSRAVVSARARVGMGAAIMPGAVVNVDSEIGDGAIVNTGATVDHDCRIGECAHIAPGVNLAGNVRVGAGAFLGIGCCVIPGVSIGDWAVVGAGAAVVRDVPAGVTVLGHSHGRRA
jgi:UDP-perosamine 4-acetyltransferase